MANRPTAGLVDEYIAGFPPATQKALKALRALIRKTAPGVSERISYGIPTFDWKGHYLIYLAGWKNHISIYPVTAAITHAFREELKPYKRGKGTLQFPLGKPMPTDLIRRIVKVRLAEIS
jgi:uncharacterized protein YdhG (YjbR/CyaY superfamily)